MPTMQEKLEVARKKIIGPAEAAARSIFSSPQGKTVLKALSDAFELDLVATVPTTGAVDRDGTLINVGAAKVIQYLRDLANTKE